MKRIAGMPVIDISSEEMWDLKRAIWLGRERARSFVVSNDQWGGVDPGASVLLMARRPNREVVAEVDAVYPITDTITVGAGNQVYACAESSPDNGLVPWPMERDPDPERDVVVFLRNMRVPHG